MKLFVEGGGKGDSATKCREGFNKFLKNAGLQDRMPRIVACGSRNQAYDDFCIAINNHEDAILLVDSEGPVADNINVWRLLRWQQPNGSEDKHCHLMVQCMESWFFADVETLQEFFGQNFSKNVLSKISGNSIEDISKNEVLNMLKQLGKNAQKGSYDKGKHSFEILGRIQPERVMQASPWAKRFVETLKVSVEV